MHDVARSLRLTEVGNKEIPKGNGAVSGRRLHDWADNGLIRLEAYDTLDGQSVGRL